jgi:hypothetical protein
VRKLDQQAAHAVTYVLLCRYGDYASEILHDPK